jgi:hypothetical protein
MQQKVRWPCMKCLLALHEVPAARSADHKAYARPAVLTAVLQHCNQLITSDSAENFMQYTEHTRHSSHLNDLAKHSTANGAASAALNYITSMRIDCCCVLCPSLAALQRCNSSDDHNTKAQLMSQWLAC